MCVVKLLNHELEFCVLGVTLGYPPIDFVQKFIVAWEDILSFPILVFETEKVAGRPKKTYANRLLFKFTLYRDKIGKVRCIKQKRYLLFIRPITCHCQI